MNTVKLTVTLTPFDPWHADLLIADLADNGFYGFVETTQGFEAYIAESGFDESTTSQLIARKAQNHEIHYQVEVIKARNWNEVWESHFFQPLLISGQLLVRAPFHTEVPPFRTEIIIEPGMAFGTGHHETTSLVLEMMLEEDISGKTVLDMGCGTGILAILAAKQGAAAVTAVDTDPWAIQATIKNSAVNHITVIHPFLGDSRIARKETCHLIVANIHKNVVIADLDTYAAILKPGGVLIVSGFFETDLHAVTAAASNSGLRPAGSRNQNQWAAARFVLPEPGASTL